MNYNSRMKSGQVAFLRGVKRENNPISNANARKHWDNGWLKQSKIRCRGIELIPGRSWSGCTQTNGDCPICGL